MYYFVFFRRKKNEREQQRRKENNLYFELLYLVLGEPLHYHRPERAEIVKRCIETIWNLREIVSKLSEIIKDNNIVVDTQTPKYVLNDQSLLFCLSFACFCVRMFGVYGFVLNYCE